MMQQKVVLTKVGGEYSSPNSKWVKINFKTQILSVSGQNEGFTEDEEFVM